MNTQLIQETGQSYLECLPGSILAGEQDALELVAACGEYDTDRLLLHAENLTPEFFQLRTGIAGGILLKFSNYRLKVALILRPEQVGQGKFQDWVLETNRGREFRVFFDRPGAVMWLLEWEQP
jgi:PadR family transcriptional regulator, regulatory protein AphA